MVGFPPDARDLASLMPGVMPTTTASFGSWSPSWDAPAVDTLAASGSADSPTSDFVTLTVVRVPRRSGIPGNLRSWHPQKAQNGTVVLGSVDVDLRTLATGPVSQCLVLTPPENSVGHAPDRRTRPGPRLEAITSSFSSFYTRRLAQRPATRAREVALESARRARDASSDQSGHRIDRIEHDPAYGDGIDQPPDPSLVTSLCLSFEAIAADVRTVSLRLTDLSLTLDQAVSAPYVVASFLPARMVSGNVGPLPAILRAFTKRGLAQQQTRSSSDPPTLDSGDDKPDKQAALLPRSTLPYLSTGASLSQPPPLVVSSERLTSSDNPKWDALPELLVPACSLAALAHGVLQLRVHDASSRNELVASVNVPFHDLWGAVVSGGNHRFTVDLKDPAETASVAAMSAGISVRNVPTTGQMLCGINTTYGIFGSRPIIFGAPLPNVDKPLTSGVLTSSEAAAEGEAIPQGWIELLDSFGYTYWHNRRTSEFADDAENSWVKPDPSGAVPDTDEELVRSYRVERTAQHVYRSVVDGTETWIHPHARRESCLPRALENASAFPAHSDAPSSSASQEDESVSYNLSKPPATALVALPQSGVSEDVTHDASEGRPLGSVLADEHGCTTEMRWTKLDIPGICAATDGHTLTRHSDQYVLRFGGSTTDLSKVNSVYKLDPRSLSWSPVQCVGPTPEGRAGHGAVSLGPHQSRMLIFGGVSRLGRLNDLHVFDVERSSWSPVVSSGPAPCPRARHSMAVCGDAALVFGGRDGYRYLSDRYFNDLHCFNAARSEWFPLRTKCNGPWPAPRSGCVAEVLDERRMLVHGGYDEKTYFGDTWILDMVSWSWEKLPYPDEPTQPPVRESHASATLSNAALVYGGDKAGGGFHPDLFMFDATRLRWVGSPACSGHSPGGLSGAAMVALDDSAVVLNGGSTGFSSTWDTYVLDTAYASVRDIAMVTEAGLARGQDADACVICMEESRPVDHMFVFCGHIVVCSKCAKRPMDTCPICRAPVAKIVRLER